MPKHAIATNHAQLRLDASLTIPLYKQLYERLRGAILAGQLERGARLPSTRLLASELGVSRSTTALAYEMLLLEGFLESRVGQGTVVARDLPAFLLTEQSTSWQAEQPNAPKPRSARRRHEDQPSDAKTIFRGGEPALDLFPYDTWARLIARHARHSLPAHARYQAAAGYFPLREAIAAQIGITRGVRCTPDQIIMTAGSQGALDLAIRTLLKPQEPAWIENPGYFGAQGALAAAGARLVPVPVDEQGLDVARGQMLCPTARLVSTTPSHQFPTGVTMSLHRRLALLEWASQAEAWILEDDYDSEYRFSGRPLEALQGLDRDGRVIYIGTFSKTLFPALRLGYLVAPMALIEPLLATRTYIDVHVPILEQLALNDFLREGHFARHLRHMLRHYQQRRDVLASELRTHMGELLDVHAPEVGMHLVGWLPADKDDRRAAELATQAGLSVTPISDYSLAPLPRGGLLFGYASTSEDDIRIGVRRLAAALERL